MKNSFSDIMRSYQKASFRWACRWSWGWRWGWRSWCPRCWGWQWSSWWQTSSWRATSLSISLKTLKKWFIEIWRHHSDFICRPKQFLKLFNHLLGNKYYSQTLTAILSYAHHYVNILIINHQPKKRVLSQAVSVMRHLKIQWMLNIFIIMCKSTEKIF